jgi:hypothetical protein
MIGHRLVAPEYNYTLYMCLSEREMCPWAISKYGDHVPTQMV